MALRFKAANEAFGVRGVGDSRTPHDGRVVLALDSRGVAGFKRLDNGSPLQSGEIAMSYRIRGEEPKFATNAFFFQEGHAEEYARARYGEFRVAESGECILTGLRDENLIGLGAPGTVK